MNLNLLFDMESLDWADMSIDKSDCLDKIQEVISEVQNSKRDGYNHEQFKPNSFDNLDFAQLFNSNVLVDLNAEWFIPYAYSTFAQIYALPLTPKSADSLNDLKTEFPNVCNALFGCQSDNKDVVYDVNSYKTVQLECERPKLRIPANQINQLISTHYKHLFERLDTPSLTEKGVLHGEQIQIHINDGSTKNIGALNIDGSWKHPPTKEKHRKLPNESKVLLTQWGFKLPEE